MLPAWFCDRKLRLIEVNDAFCDLLRRSREELLGRNLPEFTHPDELRLDQSTSGPKCSRASA